MSPTRDDLARNRDEVIEIVFRKNYRKGAHEVPFTMDDVRRAIAQVAKKRPSYKEKNVADVRYQYTSGRSPLAESIDKLGPWMIVGKGKAKYAFAKLAESPIVSIPTDLYCVSLPDATPEIVLEYVAVTNRESLPSSDTTGCLTSFWGSLVTICRTTFARRSRTGAKWRLTIYTWA